MSVLLEFALPSRSRCLEVVLAEEALNPLSSCPLDSVKFRIKIQFFETSVQVYLKNQKRNIGGCLLVRVELGGQ